MLQDQIRVTRRERIMDFIVRCESCGRLMVRTIARKQGWVCDNEKYDIWYCKEHGK